MIQRINHLSLEQEVGLRYIIKKKEGMIIVTLDSKHPR